jgi:predicted esterase YcpF (UPF0227 family)
MGRWLAENRPEIRYLCPLLTPYPGETRTTLERLVTDAMPGPVYLMGSSLGGWWATWLAEKYDLKAVLINPAVDMSAFNDTYINVPLKSYHTEDTYLLTREHAEGFRAADIKTIRRPKNYFVLLQKGDEVLDYRLAVKKYAGSRQSVEEGGDHSFVNFESHIQEIMEFLEE